MSTPAETGTGAGAAAGSQDVDRRKSLGKYVKRMSSVFKRDKPAKGSASAAGTTTTTTPAAASSTTAAPVEKKEVTTDVTPTPAVASAPPPAPPAPATQQLNRSALQQERARALFAKYGLTLESHEWIATPVHPISVQRVEKPIRMRVHRNCHRCGTTYGADKTCVQCEHRRCKKCPRYPKKKTPATDQPKDIEAPQKPKRKKLLTIPTKDGKELAYQTPTQRVRRTCHKCQELFIPPTGTVCSRCHHHRCTKCPREPAKLSKWPNGYPGDVDHGSETEVERELEGPHRVWRKPRTRVRWECEECHGLFLDGSPQCPGCGHERCEKCTRAPLKRSKKEREFSPEVVRAVEAKLKALAVQEDAPATPAIPI